MRKQLEIPVLEKAAGKLQEVRTKLKSRVAQMRPAGRAQRDMFPKVKAIREDIRDKGLIPTLRTKTMRVRGQVKRPHERAAEEIEPAYPKTRLVKETQEIAGTVGKREIAIEV